MLTPNTIGKAVADYIASAAPSPGSPITGAQLESLWENILTMIYTDLKTNAVVVPTSLESPQGPVTGTGNIE